MIGEARRRAYLEAMQVGSWLPRVALPFAAPSRPELLSPPEPEVIETPPLAAPGIPVRGTPKPAEVAVQVPARKVVPLRSRQERAAPAAADVQPAPHEEKRPVQPVPRFSLQLLRAGRCLLLVELPTGEPFQGRDPGYLLLRDLLRAARLPHSPQLVGDGEPIRWPLLAAGNFDQSAAAAREYVQGVVAVERELAGCACLWLIGESAQRFAAGEPEAGPTPDELRIESLGSALVLPGLEAMMNEPRRKADAWRVLRRGMPLWADEEHE